MPGQLLTPAARSRLNQWELIHPVVHRTKRFWLLRIATFHHRDDETLPDDRRGDGHVRKTSRRPDRAFRVLGGAHHGLRGNGFTGSDGLVCGGRWRRRAIDFIRQTLSTSTVSDVNSNFARYARTDVNPDVEFAWTAVRPADCGRYQQAPLKTYSRLVPRKSLVTQLFSSLWPKRFVFNEFATESVNLGWTLSFSFIRPPSLSSSIFIFISLTPSTSLSTLIFFAPCLTSMFFHPSPRLLEYSTTIE